MKVAVSPERAELAPGQDIELAITVANDGQQVLTPVFGVSGMDPSLVVLPEASIGVGPGERVTTVVGVRVPEDAVPGEQRLGVSVADAEGQHRPVAAVVVVRVGARPDVAVEVDPPAVRGRRKARFTTVLRNRADEPQVVQLDGSGAGVAVRFAADEIVLEPREEVHVRTTVRRTGHTWIREMRHGALIDVHGVGMPVSTTATFTQKPLVPVWWRKLVATIAAFALWAGVVVAVDRFMDRDDPAGVPIAGEEGEDADADAPGPGDLEEEADPAGRPFMIQGTVDGPREPIGTSVVVERLAFGDEGTTDGEGDSKIAPLTPVVRTTISVLDKIETSTVDGGRFRIRSGLEPEAFYRVTASRAGFDTQSQVVNITAEEPEIDVAMELEPSSGSMSGRVVDQSGAGLGEVEVIVTDGDLVFHTLTDTAGSVGAWSLSGLTTPATYQIITTLEGYSTATTIVELEAGGSLSGITSRMSLGMGTIRGALTDDTDAGVGGIEVTAVGDEVERMTSTVTDPGLEGGFTLPGLPLGTYELTFRGHGFQTQSAVVELTTGDVVVPRRRMSVSTAELFGVVLLQVAPTGGCDYPDPDQPEQRDNAVPGLCGGVGVTLNGEPGVFRTTTNAFGGFRKTGVPPGDYTLSFERYGYYPEHFEVTLGANDRIHVPASMLGDDSWLYDLPEQDLHPVLRRTSARSTFADNTFADNTFADNTFADNTFEESFELRAGEFLVMELLPAPTDEIGEIQGVLRDSRDPGQVIDHFDTSVFPTPPVIEVENQPNAEVELLADGGFKISRLLPGAHTVRIIAPGYDVDTFVARVGRDQAADAGSRLLIPFGSLNLRVTDGLEFPIPDAVVFLTTADPALVGRLNPDNADPVYDVRTCTVSRDAAGRWREGEGGLGDDERQGLCATVTDAGDAQFNQALPTGRYEVTVPVNEVDLAESDDPSVRAATVPLDHEPVTRDIDVRSGETARSDFRLRRYAILEGRLLEPTEDALISVGDEVFGAGRVEQVVQAFPGRSEDRVGIELRAFANGESFEPAPGLGPRLSFGASAGLLPGNYRIDRILPDEAGVSRQYELEVRAEDESQARFLRANDTAIEGLAYGQRQLVNAILSPRAVDVDLAVSWFRLDGTEMPLNQVSAELSGLVELRVDGDGMSDAVETIRVPADPVTARMSTVGRFFGNDPGRPASFLEGSPLNIEMVYDPEIAAFFRPFGTQTVRPRLPEDNTVWVRDFEVEPRSRNVLALVSVPVGGPDTDRGYLERLGVRLQPVTGPYEVGNREPGTPLPDGVVLVPPDQLSGSGASGLLRIDATGIRPDRYRLEVRGEGIFDIVTEPFSIMPGDPNLTVRIGEEGVGSERPIVIDRQVDLTVGVYERFDPAWPGQLSSQRPFAEIRPSPIGNAEVALLLDGEPVTEADDSQLTTGADGRATFRTLRGGEQRPYSVRVEVDGYPAGEYPLIDVSGAANLLLDELDAGVEAPTLDLVDNQRGVELVRFGEVAGSVESLLDARCEADRNPATCEPFDDLVARITDAERRFGVARRDVVSAGPLAGATVELLSASGDDVLHTTTTRLDDGEARFRFDQFARLADGTYRLRITAEDHDPIIIEGVLVRAGRRTQVETYAPLERTTLTGLVTEAGVGDPTATIAPGDPVPNVRVRAADPTVDLMRANPRLLRTADGSPAVAVTGESGTFTISGLPPYGEPTSNGGELLASVLFDEYTSVGDLANAAQPEPQGWVQTSRRPQELDRRLMAGQTVRADIDLLGEYIALQGEVTARSFTGGPESRLAGATVTAECVEGPCEADAPQFTTTTNASGRYQFEVLPVGSYRLTITRDGYAPFETGDRPVIVRFVEGIGEVRNALLTAETVEVRLGIRSAIDSVGAISDLRVDAVYRAEGGERTPSAEQFDLVGIAGADGNEPGFVTFDLPPGRWDFVTSNASRADVQPRPHLDGRTSGFEIPPPTLRSFDADGNDTAVFEPVLTLNPYVAVTGAVVGRDHPRASGTTILGNATVFPDAQSRALTDAPIYAFDPDDPTRLSDTAVVTNVDGRFGLYLPPSTLTDRVWRMEVSREDYDRTLLQFTVGTVDIEVTDATVLPASVIAPDERLPGALTDAGVVLTATPISVPITVDGRDLIGDPDGSRIIDPDGQEVRLGGVRVTASWDDAGPDPFGEVGEFDEFYRDTALTGTVGTREGQVTLRLAPGEWTLETDGASSLGYVDLRRDATNARYHGPQGTTVAIGASSTRRLELAAFADLELTAQGRRDTVAGSGEVSSQPVGLPDVEVTLFEETCGDPPVRERVRGFTDDEGRFAAEGLAPEQVCLRLQQFSSDPGAREFETRLATLERDFFLRSGPNELDQATTRLLPEQGQVIGRVLGRATVNDDPEILPSPTVRIFQAGLPWAEADVGDGGFYEVSALAPGTYELVVGADGYDEYRQTFTLLADVGLTLDVVLGAEDVGLRVTLTSSASGSGDVPGSLEGLSRQDVFLTDDPDPEAATAFFEATYVEELSDGRVIVTFDQTVSPTPPTRGSEEQFRPGDWYLTFIDSGTLGQPHLDLIDARIDVGFIRDGDSDGNRIHEAEVTVTRFASLQGTFELRDIAGGELRPASPSSLVGVDIDGVVVSEFEVGDEGAFVAWIRNPATLTLRSRVPGYINEASTLLIRRARFGNGRDVTGIELEAIANPVRSEIRVRSSGEGSVLPGDLSGIEPGMFEVEADFGAGVGTVERTASSVVFDPGTPGVARVVFAGAAALPPNSCWNLRAIGLGTLDQPHEDLSEGCFLDVAPADDVFEVPATLVLQRWASLSGEVIRRDLPDAESTLAEGVEVEVRPQGSGQPSIGSDTTNADGRFAVWLDPDLYDQGSNPWIVVGDVTLEGYDVDRRPERVRVGGSASRDVSFATPVELLAKRVEVTVALESDAIGRSLPPDLTGIGGVTFSASAGFPADDGSGTSIPVSHTAVSVSSHPDTPGLASLTFELEPNLSWTLASDGLVDLLEQPHFELDGTDEVRVDASDHPVTIDPPVDISRYASVSGTVLTRPVAEADTAPAVSATVKVTAASGGAGTQDTDADGEFLIWLPVPTPESSDVSVTEVTLEGYELLDDGRPAPVTVDTSIRDQGFGDVILTARPVDVEVPLASSNAAADLTGIAGATFTASASFAPDVVVSRTASVEPGASPSEATLRFDGDEALPPGDWELRSSGLAGLDQPHFEVDGVDFSVAPSNVGVSLTEITLERYASVAGTVTGRLLDELDPQPVSGTVVTVEPDGGPVTSVTTATDGAYLAWLAIPVSETVSVTVSNEEDGYEPASEQVEIAESARDAADVDLALLATTTAVTFEVASSFSGGVVSGTVELELTATVDGRTVSRTLDTARFEDAPVSQPQTVDLGPASWTVQTVDAEQLRPPHAPASSTFEVLLSPGAGASQTVELGIDPLPSLTGTATLRAFEGAGSAWTPTDAGYPAQITVDPAVGAQVHPVSPTFGTDDGVLTWSVFFPDDTVSRTVTIAADGFGDAVVSGTPSTSPTATTQDLVATPVVVDVGLTSVSGTQTVSLTAETGSIAGPTSPTSYTLETGDIEVAPGGVSTTSLTLWPADDWQVTVNGTVQVSITSSTGVDNAEINPDPNLLTFGLPPRPPSDGPASIGLELDSNSVLLGQVFEDRDGTLVPLDGVLVRAAQPSRAFSTTSAERDGQPGAYRLRAQSGSWEISAVRSGRMYVIDEQFEIRRDGPGTEPNRLDIILPWLTADISGRVTNDAGASVAGATITAASALEVITATSDEDGVYRLEGLDPDVPWSVTFTPPPGAQGQAPVTRFLAAGNLADAEIVLDQDLPSGYGHLEVRVLEAEPGAPLEVELVEQTVFPTMNEEGRRTQTVTASAEGTATVRFEDLVPGNGRSIPQNRFTVTATQGDTTRTASNLEVFPAMTTTTELVFGVVVTRSLELVVDGPEGPVTGTNVRLERDPYVFTGQAEHDTNRYRFTDLPVGTWTVLVEGYLPATVEVTAGEGILERGVVLAFDPDVARDEDAEPDPLEQDAEDGTLDLDAEVDDAEPTDDADPSDQDGQPQPGGDQGDGDGSGSSEGSGTGGDDGTSTSGTPPPGDHDEAGTDDPDAGIENGNGDDEDAEVSPTGGTGAPISPNGDEEPES